MGFTEADIIEMKAAIPSQHHPRLDHGSMLTNCFCDVAEPSSDNNPFVDNKARETAGLALIGHDSADAGFMLTGAQVAMQTHSGKTEQEKRAKERAFYDQIQAALERRLAELNAEIAAIDMRLEQIRLRRDTIANRLDAIDDINALLASGQLDPNNPAHAAILRRAGYNETEAMNDNFTTLIAQDRHDLAREDDGLADKASRLLIRREEAVSEKNRVNQALTDLDTAETDDARLTASRRAQSVLESQGLSTAPSTPENSNAVQADTDQFYAESDEFDWDAPPPSSPVGL